MYTSYIINSSIIGCSLEFAKVSVGQDGTRNRCKVAKHNESVIVDGGFVLGETENLFQVQRQNG
jgi:hypothetical protein